LLKLILIGLTVLLAANFAIPLIAVPVDAQIEYTHRRIYDDAFGNSIGWNPDNQTKAFGISDDRFNVGNSIVLINTNNFVLPGVVCHVDYRAIEPTGPAFEVNCGNGNPGAPAPLDGTYLDYLIITMPFSPPDVAEPTEGPIEPLGLRTNTTDTMQMANQTNQTR